jgi:acetylornithine deacetylase/succinyl-diaminopimelate desuccinylase-like protein
MQPAEEPDWKTNSFEMTAVDGYLCGRGTSDNKGPVLAFIYAVKVCVGSGLVTERRQERSVQLMRNRLCWRCT